MCVWCLCAFKCMHVFISPATWRLREPEGPFILTWQETAHTEKHLCICLCDAASTCMFQAVQASHPNYANTCHISMAMCVLVYLADMYSVCICVGEHVCLYMQGTSVLCEALIMLTGARSAFCLFPGTSVHAAFLLLLLLSPWTISFLFSPY